MSRKLSVAVSIVAVSLACIVSTVGANGQVVDHDKVVENPYLDYKKANKEIAASEAAERSRQAAALAAQAQSVGQDEASFQASLASVAQALNAAAPDQDVTAAAPPVISPEPRAGISTAAVIALVVIGAVAIMSVVLITWSSLRRKSRRRRPKESSVSLVDFARKPDDQQIKR
jgi:hypothetical protein